MQDRVSANPGRVLITPESGEAYYATIERADNPSVIGTALNKASLLTDTTAADYGLDSTATPNDALQALKTNRRPWRVGDILETKRTDLGDKWILCNGAQVSSSEYPELYEMTELSINGNWDNYSSSQYQTLVDITSNDEYYVACGEKSDYPWIFYSSNGTTWTSLQLSTSTSVVLTGICWTGTYFVACGYVGGLDGKIPFIYYATNPAGPWTEKQISTANEGFLTAKVRYVNGYIVVCGLRGYSSLGQTSSASRPIILYARNPTSTFKEKEIASIGSDSGHFYIVSIAYGNSRYVVCANGSGDGRRYIFYASSLSGTWTSVNPSGESLLRPADIIYSSSLSRFLCLDCGEGGVNILYSTNGTSWNIVSVSSSTAAQNLGGITYFDGKFYVCCTRNGALLYSSSSYSGPWEEKQLKGSAYATGILEKDSMITVCGYKSNIANIWRKGKTLPIISVDSAYAYIKAKE